MNGPEITVIMPVYNGGHYLRPAIDSILAQTYENFELLIIDDGSKDDSLAICRSYSDARLRIVENGVNLGLVATLNKALDLALGKYIARMDCDDISLPERLEKQWRFMEAHPDYGGCGTWYSRLWDGPATVSKFPVEDADIRFYLTLDNPFLHSSMFLRRSVLEQYALRYDPRFLHAEDYEFWARCAGFAKFANLPEVLLRYRYHTNSVSHVFRAEQCEAADRVRARQLAALGIYPEADELSVHHAIVRFQFRGDITQLQQVKCWLEKLAQQSTVCCGISLSSAYRQLAHYWYGACGRSDSLGWRTWRLFRASPIGRAAEPSWQLKMLWRCLLGRRIEVA